MITEDTNPLARLFLDATARYPDRVALRTPQRDITYSRLRTMAVGLARQLRTEGVGRDSLVGLDPTLRNGTEIVLSILAVTLLGAPWMMYAVYPQGLPIRLTHLLHAAPRRPQGGDIRAVEVGLLLERAELDPSEAWEELPGYRSADDTWALCASSGTTGTPKCLRLTGRTMFAAVLQADDYSRSTTPFVAAILPSRNSYQGCLYLFRLLYIGGTYVLSNDYPYLAGQRVDLIVGSPAHLAALLRDTAPPAAPVFGEFRSGGAPTARRMSTRLLKFARTLRVAYGATEAGSVCNCLVREDNYNGSVGTPQGGARVEIVDERDHPLGPDSEGIVRVCTPSQLDGYLGDDEATAQAFRDGWFYPGDRGYLSQQGELYITGRIQDHLNAGGTKVNGAAVDDVMQGTDGVADALCFVETGAEGAERLAALVVVDPDKDPQAVARALVKSLLRSQLHDSVYPRNIYRVNEIPRNDNGKPMRRYAAALVEGLRPLARIGAGFRRKPEGG